MLRDAWTLMPRVPAALSVRVQGRRLDETLGSWNGLRHQHQDNVQRLNPKAPGPLGFDLKRLTLILFSMTPQVGYLFEVPGYAIVKPCP